jgi:dipeptidase D
VEKVLKGLKPERVFYYFEEITKIPRCSGCEENISNYLMNFAKSHKLYAIQDKALNVIIKKEGTKGYENSPTVVIQGHMDMVCEKEKGIKHDFSKDSIKLKVDGDYIMAEGTTLGADDGIAVAFCLALLESDDVQHPPLEVLITTSEETGMSGAVNLDPKLIDGRILINIDSEEEGKLLTSCAGGGRNRIKIPIIWENIYDKMTPFNIKITGLRGGHSGSEIDKGRGNANKILGRLLFELDRNIDYRLVNIEGGSKSNAIPTEAEALILIKDEEYEDLRNTIDNFNKNIMEEYRVTDKNVSILLEDVHDDVEEAFSKDTKEKVIYLIMLVPNGVQTMHKEIKGLVEASNNLGIIETKSDVVVFENAPRSSNPTLKEYILNQFDIIASVLGGESEIFGLYPEWQYDPNSYIRNVFEKVYKEKFGTEAEITAIHAGLECGLFKEKFGDMDMISFGPDMFGVHTPKEKLSISSTERTWELLIEVLKEIK